MSFHDEDHCVAAISTALQQTAVRLTGHASPPHCGFPESAIAAAARTSAAEPLLSLHETAEFFAVLDSLIANASSEERARTILFDIDAALIPAVLQLFATDALAVPGGDLEPLLTAALATFRRIVTLPKMASVASADGAGASPDAGNVIPYVARVAIDMAMQAALPGRLAEILVAGHSVTVQLAASDLLFALALRSAAALRILATVPAPRSADGLPAPKPNASVSALAHGADAQPAAPQSSVDSLLATIGQGDSTDPRVRAFAAATLREVATAHPEAVAASALSLARAVTLDAASDVRTLSAEALEITLSVDIALGARVVSACRRELCAALLHAVEKEPDPAALEAVLKLLAATLAVDATVAEQLQNATQSSFAELFVAGSGDGILVDTLRVGAKVASLAARALRLLIQHAPASRRVGHGLVAHERHTVTIIRALATATDFVNDAEAQRQANGGESVVDHMDLLAASICRVEIATAIALILAQDPIARRELRAYFTRYDDQKRQLGSSGGLASPGLAGRGGLESGGASISSTEKMHGLIMAALSTAALECFAGIAVMDVTGTWLNNPHKVQWQAPADAPTPASPEVLRPTQDSVLALISAQEERAVAYLEAARDPMVPQAFSAPPEAAGPCDDEPTYRLTFVLLTLTVHTAFTADYEVPTAKASGRAQATTDQTPLQSSQPHYARAVDFYKTIDPSAPPATEKTPVRAVRGDTTVVPPAALVAVDGETSEQRRRGAAEAQVVRDETFTQFDQALSLATHFAVMFNAVGAPKPVVYETKGALVRRQPKQASWFAAPTPNSRSWGVDQLKQGDLFYFLLPTHSITAYALDQCRRMAARHAQYIKKSFVITPQAAKARRWFLFDMLNHIMPGISAALTELLDLCAAHGDEAVKFPMILFQQQELAAAEAAATAGGGQDYVSAAGVSDMVALHAGNLIATVEQVRFYFENNQHVAGSGGAAFDATNAAAAAMSGARVGPATAGDQMTSQYLHDVERKIEALNRMEFTGGAGSKFFDPVRAIRETDAALSGQPMPQDTHWAE